MSILVTRLKPDVRLPSRATQNSMGHDLHAYIKTETGRPSKMMIAPHSVRAIPTGLVAVAPSIETQSTFFMIASRSGMARQRNLFVANSPGIIDPDYRGEIVVLLTNVGTETQWVEDGDRIAQMLVMPATFMDLVESSYDLRNDLTDRGEKGFGSTGR